MDSRANTWVVLFPANGLSNVTAGLVTKQSVATPSPLVLAPIFISGTKFDNESFCLK